MSSPAIRIVIVGAGVGGLTLALPLRRRGITAEVLGQAPELHEVGHDVLAASRGTTHDKERIMRPDVLIGGTA